MGTVFRKESAQPLEQEFQSRVEKGYYRDLNVSGDEKDDESYGSSLDIKEDEDDLDEEN